MAKQSTKKRDYYEVLGVSRKASDKEIRAAFRRLARKHHPDVNPGDQSAGEKFKEINEAYQVLSDPEQRKRYDQYGHTMDLGEAFRQGQSGPFVWRFETGGFRPGDEFDFGGGSIFDDILGSVLRGRGHRSPFGGGSGAGSYQRGSRHPFENVFTSQKSTRDIEHPVEVTLEEAYRGTKRTIEFMDGGRPRRLEVKIPRGVKTGSKVQINPGRDKDSAVGAISLVITVKPDPRFQVNGSDLTTEVEVPMLDAILGGEAVVPTLDGRVSLKIPSGTQNGSTFRLKGKGMPVLGKAEYGDLFAKIKVVLPTDLNNKERKLIEELRKERNSRGAKV